MLAARCSRRSRARWRGAGGGCRAASQAAAAALVPLGFGGGEVPKLAMTLPLLKNFSVVGVFAGAWEDKEPEAARQAKETLMDWVAAGRSRPHVGRVLRCER